MDPFLEDAPKKKSGPDLKGLWRAFWRRRLLFAVPFLLCLTMAIVTIKTMMPIYYSRAQIQVTKAESRSRLITDQQVSYRRPRAEDVRAEIETIVTAPRFLAKVIDEFQLGEAIQAAAEAREQPVPSLEHAKQIADSRLQHVIRVGIDGLNLYTIGVVDPDPAKAYELTRYIVDLFIVEYRETQVRLKGATRDFLTNQRTEYQTELDTAEKALSDFLSGMANEELTGNPINAANLATATEKLGLLRERIYGQDASELADLEATAQQVLGTLPSLTPYTQDVVATRILRELEDLGVSLLTQMQGLPMANQLENDIAQLRVRLNSRIEDRVAINYPQLGLMDRNRISQYIYFNLFRGAETRLMNRLTDDIAAFRDFAARQPAQSARLQELQDEVARLRDLIQTVEAEITQQTLNYEAGLSDVVTQLEVRREPRIPTSPFQPDKKKLAFMGFVLSFVLGIGLVVVSIFLDRSFTSVADIESALDLRVIGTLPVIRDDYFERKRELRVLRWVTIVLGILAIAAVGFLVIYPRLV